MVATSEKSGAVQSASPNQIGADYKTISSTVLRVGIKLRIPVYDENDVLLLGKGQVISTQFMTLLRHRGVTTVKVHESELPRVYAGQPQGTSRDIVPESEVRRCDLKTDQTDFLDEALKSESVNLHPQGSPLLDELIVHGKVRYSSEFKEEFIEKQEQSVKRLGTVFESMQRKKELDIGALNVITDDAIDGLKCDSDLFSCLSINPYSSDYPSRHSIHTSMLAIAIGIHLKLDKPTLRELSVGCLIHDVGMARIAPTFKENRGLTDVELLEVSKHPIVVFDMVKSMSAIPTRSAFIAYQMHERNDGTGYPRGREARQIHFLSKVAAVADCYIGLVSKRPHRPAMHPYFAITHILNMVSSGKFDSLAVRALLRTISMFPLGSYVKLENDERATVIRSNDDLFTKPIVEVYDRTKSVENSEIVDLKDDDTPQIVSVTDCLDE